MCKCVYYIRSSAIDTSALCSGGARVRLFIRGVTHSGSAQHKINNRDRILIDRNKQNNVDLSMEYTVENRAGAV